MHTSRAYSLNDRLKKAHVRNYLLSLSWLLLQGWVENNCAQNKPAQRTKLLKANVNINLQKNPVDCPSSSAFLLATRTTLGLTDWSKASAAAVYLLNSRRWDACDVRIGRYGPSVLQFVKIRAWRVWKLGWIFSAADFKFSHSSFENLWCPNSSSCACAWEYCFSIAVASSRAWQRSLNETSTLHFQVFQLRNQTHILIKTRHLCSHRTKVQQERAFMARVGLLRLEHSLHSNIKSL